MLDHGLFLSRIAGIFGKFPTEGGHESLPMWDIQQNRFSNIESTDIVCHADMR
jgi:hypothetical protein